MAGFTPASTRGDIGEVVLRVATYNIGAKTDTMFAGPRRREFEEKLDVDLRMVADHAEVICVQVCAPFWHNHISTTILPQHTSASVLSDGIVCFVSPGIVLADTPKSLDIFPGEVSLYRGWRKFLQVRHLILFVIPHARSIIS